MSSKAKIRVLLSKSGLDYHDRGVRYIATKFKEAGMEVIYTQFRVIDEVAKAAVQEDVDIIGLSCSSGGYLADVQRLAQLLKESERPDIPILIGGIIADRDIPKLLEMGVGGVYGPGSPPEEAIEWIERHVAKEA